MILQLFCPRSDGVRPFCKGLPAPEGKIRSGERAQQPPAVARDHVLDTQGTISAEVAIYIAEDFSEPSLSPRFKHKLSDIMRRPRCTLPNCCFLAMLMRKCFMCS